jgi:chemotaxis protein methyltransferase CheR
MLAMLLLDAYPTVNHSRFDILATDLSRRALAKARAATYDPYSLRHTEAYWKTKYFEPTSDGQMAVRQEVRQLLRFEHGNLFTGELNVSANSVDAVLCRNVIIYFDEKSRQRVLMNLYNALKPGGYLMLGHSESLAHVASPFELTKLDRFIMYRKGVK